LSFMQCFDARSKPHTAEFVVYSVFHTKFILASHPVFISLSASECNKSKAKMGLLHIAPKKALGLCF